MPEFLKNLNKEARVAAAWKIALICFVTLGSCVAFLALLDLVDRFMPWKEDSIATLLGGAIGLLALAFVMLAFRAYRLRPKPQELAAKVEEANPELMDTLNCAVDLIEKKGGGYNRMEDCVLKVAAEKTDAASIAKATRPDGRAKWLTLIAIGFASGMIAYGLRWSPAQKAFGHFSGAPGLRVTTRLSALDGSSENPADWEYARGSDVSVFADVLRAHRGSKEAFLEYEQNGRLLSMQMLSTGDTSRFEFIAPSLREKLRYRVTTPSLTGDWHELIPYSPPELRKVTWRVRPPDYVGLPESEHMGFATNKVPENSSLLLEAVLGELPLHVTAEVLGEDGSRLRLDKGPNGTRLLARKLSEPWKGRIELRDADAPRRAPVLSDEFSFLMIRDEPPVVEITEPAKDLELPADGNLLIEFFAVDDYGVAEAEVVVSHAGKRSTANVFVDPVEKEKSLTHVLALGDMSLAVGDVVSYHAVIADNKEPEAQRTRSEIYFIEVLPPQGEPREGEGMEGERKEVPVRDFINRTKKIIRATYDALAEEGKEREKRAVAITSDALSLKHDMTKVYDEFDGQFPVVQGIDTSELLNEATYFIEQTEIFLGDGELNESLEPSEETLRKLVLLYALLRQNPMKGKGKGKGKSESKEEETEQDEKPDQSAQDQPDDPAEQLKALGEALERTSGLKERQQDLNARIGRAARNGKTGEINKEMAGEQDELRDDLEDLRDELYDRSGRLGDVRSFDQAGGDMEKSEDELREDDPSAAKPHGIRAAEALANAEKELEGRMLAAGVAMLDALEKDGRGLAERETENAAKTGAAQPGEGEGLKKKQDKINEEAKDLLSKIEQAGLSLRDLNENATLDLYGAAREAREGGIESSGKRASNALLYEAFPRAKKEEDKVAGELEKTADKLGDVKRKLANQGNLALRELIEDLKKNREELPGKGDEEMREMAEEAASRLGALPQTEGDQLLQDIMRFFDKVASDEKASRAKTAANHALNDTIQRLEEYFWKDAAEERLRRNHETTAAPRKYKRQVEEYFRRIAEGR